MQNVSFFEVEKEPSKSYSLRITVHTGWSVNVYDVYKLTLFDLPGENFFNQLFGWGSSSTINEYM